MFQLLRTQLLLNDPGLVLHPARILLLLLLQEIGNSRHLLLLLLSLQPLSVQFEQFLLMLTQFENDAFLATLPHDRHEVPDVLVQSGMFKFSQQG